MLDSKNPEVTITSPKGGEELIVNEMVSVNWNSFEDNSALNPVTVLISTSENEIYTELNGGIENSGSSNITIPNELKEFAKIKISITDYYGNRGEDLSDDYFTISPIPDIAFLNTSIDIRNT